MQLELSQIIRFVVMTVIVLGLIYLFAELTPWIAKHVDKWIADYRKTHDPKQDDTYGIRSIYDLPPAKPEQPEQDEKPDDKA